MLGVTAVLAFLLRLTYLPASLYQGVPYFLDSDCYTRMFRVQKLLNEGEWIQSQHLFENFPIGIIPHTTSLLDWIIGFSALIGNPFAGELSIDWAGALVGPVIAIGWMVSVFLLTQDKPFISRVFLLSGCILSPTIVWANSFGRPDHQLLVFPLITLALLMEERRWNVQKNPSIDLPSPLGYPLKWIITSGVLWGAAMWVSLFEPLILFIITLSTNLVVRRQEQPLWIGSALGLFALTVIIEGFRFSGMAQIFSPEANLWLKTIGELESSPSLIWLVLLGPLSLALPWLLWKNRSDFKGNPLNNLVLTLICVTLFLGLNQVRWQHFTAFMLVWGLAQWLPALPKLDSLNAAKFRKAPLLLLFLWTINFTPMLGWNLFTFLTVKPPLELAEIRYFSTAIIKADKSYPPSVIAPWWQSPAILYYSGAPIVASSSHQSIEGIRDTALIFTSKSYPEAKEILQDRRAGWIVLWKPGILYKNSVETITGEPLADQKDYLNKEDLIKNLIIFKLWQKRATPNWIVPVYESPEERGVFGVYRVLLDYEPRF